MSDDALEACDSLFLGDNELDCVLFVVDDALEVCDSLFLGDNELDCVSFILGELEICVLSFIGSVKSDRFLSISKSCSICALINVLGSFILLRKKLYKLFIKSFWLNGNSVALNFLKFGSKNKHISLK